MKESQPSGEALTRDNEPDRTKNPDIGTLGRIPVPVSIVIVRDLSSVE
jgi:hypothetical protein